MVNGYRFDICIFDFIDEHDKILKSIQRSFPSAGFNLPEEDEEDEESWEIRFYMHYDSYKLGSIGKEICEIIWRAIGKYKKITLYVVELEPAPKVDDCYDESYYKLIMDKSFEDHKERLLNA